MLDEICSLCNISEKDVVDWREGKLYLDDSEYSKTYKGNIILTKDHLIFVSKKGIFTSAKKRYDVELSKISKVSKIFLTKSYCVYANTADKGAGFFKRLFKYKNIRVSMKDGKDFFLNLKKLNPEVEV